GGRLRATVRGTKAARDPLEAAIGRPRAPCPRLEARRHHPRLGEGDCGSPASAFPKPVRCERPRWWPRHKGRANGPAFDTAVARCAGCCVPPGCSPSPMLLLGFDPVSPFFTVGV